MSEHFTRSEEHTSELQSPCNLVCRLLLEKKTKHTWRFHTRAALGAPPLVVRRDRRPLMIRNGRVPQLYPRCLPRPPLTSFFFNDTATTEIYTLSLHDALPILSRCASKTPSLTSEWRGSSTCAD